MTAKKRVSRRPSGSDMKRIDAQVIRPQEYDELPELTEDMLARGKVNKGGRPLKAHAETMSVTTGQPAKK